MSDEININKKNFDLSFLKGNLTKKAAESSPEIISFFDSADNNSDGVLDQNEISIFKQKLIESPEDKTLCDVRNLFGIADGDISKNKQNKLGSCAPLAVLTCIANDDAGEEMLKKVIKQNNDGTITVTLFGMKDENNKPKTVIIKNDDVAACYNTHSSDADMAAFEKAYYQASDECRENYSKTSVEKVERFVEYKNAYLSSIVEKAKASENPTVQKYSDMLVDKNLSFSSSSMIPSYDKKISEQELKELNNFLKEQTMSDDFAQLRQNYNDKYSELRKLEDIYYLLPSEKNGGNNIAQVYKLIFDINGDSYSPTKYGINKIKDFLKNGLPKGVSMSVNYKENSSEVIKNHAYAVVDIKQSNNPNELGILVLRNPYKEKLETQKVTNENIKNIGSLTYITPEQKQKFLEQ